MVRGKKGYRARSYGGFRRARVAPRGRMSVGGSWPVYSLLAIGAVVLVMLLWRRFH